MHIHCSVLIRQVYYKRAFKQSLVQLTNYGINNTNDEIKSLSVIPLSVLPFLPVKLNRKVGRTGREHKGCVISPHKPAKNTRQ